jgi:hypothetical protein
MPKYAELSAGAKADFLAKAIEAVHKVSVMKVTSDHPELTRAAIEGLKQDLLNKIQFRSVK